MRAGADSSRAPGTPRLFDPLEQEDFLRLEHAASLKGLFRPFKGKGELEDWASECERLRDGLLRLTKRILAQTSAYPFNLLPVVLAQQTTGAGTAFLRWRSADRTRMGVALWEQLVAHTETPSALADELLALELTRLTLNMQVSLAHTLARQARECASRMAHADAIYQQRAARSAALAPPEGVM